MALLTLGGVSLEDFEVPGEVSFGGAQQLAVHKLIGGMRVIDTLGRDDAAVQWSGVFSGSQAGDRARMLDAMRAAGNQVTLSWDQFFYSVVIESLTMDFRNPWWIPYRISCAVVIDQAQSVPEFLPGLADTILDDLTSASAYFNVSQAVVATSVPDALTPGSADNARALAILASAAGAIEQNIQSVQARLNDSNLSVLVSSSGSLAQLCVARGYVGRTVNNWIR